MYRRAENEPIFGIGIRFSRVKNAENGFVLRTFSFFRGRVDSGSGRTGSQERHMRSPVVTGRRDRTARRSTAANRSRQGLSSDERCDPLSEPLDRSESPDGDGLSRAHGRRWVATQRSLRCGRYSVVVRTMRRAKRHLGSSGRRTLLRLPSTLPGPPSRVYSRRPPATRRAFSC